VGQNVEPAGPTHSAVRVATTSPSCPGPAPRPAPSATR
jgi:hypothetical protein